MPMGRGPMRVIESYPLFGKSPKTFVIKSLGFQDPFYRHCLQCEGHWPAGGPFPQYHSPKYSGASAPPQTALSWGTRKRYR